MPVSTNPVPNVISMTIAQRAHKWAGWQPVEALKAYLCTDRPSLRQLIKQMAIKRHALEPVRGDWAFGLKVHVCGDPHFLCRSIPMRHHHLMNWAFSRLFCTPSLRCQSISLSRRSLSSAP